jgi:AGZA family xanthine/uracil permease-like MFS transporter
MTRQPPGRFDRFFRLTERGTTPRTELLGGATTFAAMAYIIVVNLVMMLGSVTRIDFDDPTEAVPAFATLAMIVFTYNIANGLTAGLVLYPVMKLIAGRARELTGGSIVLALMCLVYYVFGLPH